LPARNTSKKISVRQEKYLARLFRRFDEYAKDTIRVTPSPVVFMLAAPHRFELQTKRGANPTHPY
jgi:hypothetical protein